MTGTDAWLSSFYQALMKQAGKADAGAPVMAQASEPAPVAAAPASHAVVQPRAIAHAPVAMVATLPRASVVSVMISPMLLHRLGVRNPDPWIEPIVAACGAHGIDTPRRMAAFLANVMIETGRLSRLVESLDYEPAGLLSTFPTHFTAATAQALGRTKAHPANQRAIAEAAYGGRLGNGPPGSGDGFKFRGRGLIQLTGRSNYTRFANKLGTSADGLVPLLEVPASAAESAAHFWEVTGCNGPADRREIDEVRLLVNGGNTGLTEVRKAYQAALAMLLN